jgi:tetraacyldisaccharide-1-P 4'-kinase
MTGHKQESNSTWEKNINLTFQQFVAYTIFVITFGASVYTFFEAIPKIDALSKETNDLNDHVALSQKDIQYLTKQVDNLQNRIK